MDINTSVITFFLFCLKGRNARYLKGVISEGVDFLLWNFYFNELINKFSEVLFLFSILIDALIYIIVESVCEERTFSLFVE